MIAMRGLSLVELMIALLLGSLLTIAATQLFLVNRQTENLQLGIAGVQDNGRFAFDYISRAFMEAGHHPSEAIVPFVLDETPYAADVDDAEILDGVQFDTVTYEVVEGRDCYGQSPFTGIKRFRVAQVDGINRLNCAAFSFQTGTNPDGTAFSFWGSAGAGALIDNVVAFQVLYGLDFDGPEDDGYGRADLYTNATRTKALASDINAGNIRIVSLRFGVLLSSDARVSLDPDFSPDAITLLDQTYTQGDNGGSEVDFEDGRLYRTYSSTVALRNLVSSL
ncbi:MAG: PilW family protein [Pseudomonadota bacterium]|nr:hypothetical protein [Pseudomonadales bacterium]MDY6921509.1 PilW family protein [Pseudomonadota bacterium]